LCAQSVQWSNKNAKVHLPGKKSNGLGSKDLMIPDVSHKEKIDKT